MILAVALRVPFIPPDENVWRSALSVGIFVVLIGIINSAALRASWFIVRGRAPFECYFLTFCYYYGVTLVLMMLINTLSDVVVKAFSPELYDLLARGAGRLRIAENDSDVTRWAGYVQLLGVLLIVVWSIAGWGAYKDANESSRTRSIGAYSIYSVLSIAIVIISLILQQGLVGNMLYPVTGSPNASKSYMASAYLAGMKADLRNLVTEQEAFFLDNNDYAGSITPDITISGKKGSGKLHFVPSLHSQIELKYIDATNWSAVITTPQLKIAPQHCGVFVGEARNAA